MSSREVHQRHARDKTLARQVASAPPSPRANVCKRANSSGPTGGKKSVRKNEDDTHVDEMPTDLPTDSRAQEQLAGSALALPIVANVEMAAPPPAASTTLFPSSSGSGNNARGGGFFSNGGFGGFNNGGLGGFSNGGFGGFEGDPRVGGPDPLSGGAGDIEGDGASNGSSSQVTKVCGYKKKPATNTPTVKR